MGSVSFQYNYGGHPPRWIYNARTVMLGVLWLAGIAVMVWVLGRKRRRA